MELRVILADDHPFVLLGLRVALEKHAGVSVVGEASTPTSLIELLQRVRCDLLVTDLSMPDASGATEDGLNLVKRIQYDWPLLRIVVMTALTNSAIVRALVSDCAISTLSKMESMDDLWQAIVASTNGGTYVGRSLIGVLAEQRDEPVELPTIPRFSKTHAEVIRRFVDGQSISEIAIACGCHPRTVNRKKREAMARLGVANDPGLFAYVRANGIGGI
ncbi:response regulator transcription factor [Paraburkholderia xenovorans]|uniref:response regulator n=1 Tax=Paraburkholderia xenovorans TaxID=36873 RepID=UPI0038BC875C